MVGIKHFPLVTFILIFLYVCLFILDLTIFKGEILEWGSGKSFDNMQINEWYRLLTGSFFHQNVLHLLGNSFAIYFVGIILENKIGRWHFLFIYLTANIGTSIVYSKIFSYTQGTGASPGIYALIACIIIFYFHNPRFINLDFGNWAVNYTLIYFILGNFIGLSGLIVHLLGLSLGSVLTILIINFIKKKDVKALSFINNVDDY